MKTPDMKKGLVVHRNDMPLYAIGVAAELVGITDQTLRLYEKHGLIKPTRRNKNRYYSENDVKWLQCIRDLIHNRKISIEGLKLLLDYAPCWEITNCPEKKKSMCSAYVNKSMSCWELSKKRCIKENGDNCDDCIVYLKAFKKP
ncbi:MAG: MerR family transcriptional regulator [Nitrospirae bacterium]|nr:MerR family transcriptional regulator [Nitrospirota bacterium]MBF0535987.1 MerR family transcriptional regulator [Nitrospirota bacterium]MBF0617892.1 MerR family transcriptional regulator [Nitrospirota bacterium]